MVKQKTRKQFYVIAYDIASNKRRVKIAKLLEGCGERANYSVFECMLSAAQFRSLQEKMHLLVHPKKDTILYYRLCVDCFSKKQVYPERPHDESRYAMVRCV